MGPSEFKQSVEQAAQLSRRQRAGLADWLNRSPVQEKSAALIEAAAAPFGLPALPFPAPAPQWPRRRTAALSLRRLRPQL